MEKKPVIEKIPIPEEWIGLDGKSYPTSDAMPAADKRFLNLRKQEVKDPGLILPKNEINKENYFIYHKNKINILKPEPNIEPKPPRDLERE